MTSSWERAGEGSKGTDLPGSLGCLGKGGRQRAGVPVRRGTEGKGRRRTEIWQAESWRFETSKASMRCQPP